MCPEDWDFEPHDDNGRRQHWAARIGRWWGRLSPGQRIGTISATVLAALITGVPAWITLFRDNDKTVVVPPSASTANRTDECDEAITGGTYEARTARFICKRSFWQEAPIIFRTSIGRWDSGAFRGLISDEGGQVEAVSVDRLVQAAPRYNGRPVYVVGQVERIETLDRAPGTFDTEVRLRGRDRTFRLIVGTISKSADYLTARGIAFGAVWVSAKGTTRFTGESQSVDTVYALGELISTRLGARRR